MELPKKELDWEKALCAVGWESQRSRGKHAPAVSPLCQLLPSHMTVSVALGAKRGSVSEVSGRAPSVETHTEDSESLPESMPPPSITSCSEEDEEEEEV
uniref:Uncharacterized protein n=1 Tax=Knipowitschia caucasica TaxID=637954 RepID=A0AAV2MN71_KNICA